MQITKTTSLPECSFCENSNPEIWQGKTRRGVRSPSQVLDLKLCKPTLALFNGMKTRLPYILIAVLYSNKQLPDSYFLHVRVTDLSFLLVSSGVSV